MSSEICGLHIEADVPLPQLRPSEVEPEVVLSTCRPRIIPNELPAGRVVVDWRNDDGSIYWALSDVESGWSFRIPGFFDLAIDRKVERCLITPNDEGSARFTSVLVSGTFAALLLALRGRHPIHASAVEVGGRCLAFAGDSGTGKSTMTALFCNAGAALVADDVLVVQPGVSKTVTAFPGSVEVRLRLKAAALASKHPSRHTVDERIAMQPPSASGPLPLVAIIEPWPQRNLHSVASHVFNPATSVQFVAENHRIGGWLQPSDLRNRFDEAAALANAVPVLSLEVPWGPPFEPDLVSRICKALRESVGVDLGDIGDQAQR